MSHGWEKTITWERHWKRGKARVHVPLYCCSAHFHFHLSLDQTRMVLAHPHRPRPCLPVPGRPMMICLRGAGWGDSAGRISGSRAVGVGWQATGCGSAPTEASWCPSDFLSLSLPPEPEDDRTEPDELGIKVGMEGLDREALPTVEGVRDWEGILEKGTFKLSGKIAENIRMWI